MQSNIELRTEMEQTNHPFRVAFTETGKVLEPKDGLRRFLIQTRDLIETDKQHFTEELFSDIFALYETGALAAEAATGSVETLEDDPFMSSLAVGSTVAAVYLLHSINAQRGAKEYEYRKALKMFVDFEQDVYDDKNGATKEERLSVAEHNLRDKMRHSGLQFVNLSDEQKRFRKSEFHEIAAQKGIGKPLTHDMVKRAGDFMRKPLQDKVVTTGQGLSYLMFQGERAAGFVGKVFTEYVKNPFRVHKIGKSTVMGFQEAARLNEDLGLQVKGAKKNTLPNQDDAKQQRKPLTLDQLHSVNLRSIETIGHDWTADEKDDLIKIMRDQESHEQSAVRAKRSLQVQSAFMGLQLAIIPIKLLSEEHRHSIGLNFYSFFAPMGPLKGFADELKAERAKANSKLADKAERLGRILGIDAESKTSKEREEDTNDNDPDDPDMMNGDNDNDRDVNNDYGLS